MTMKRTERLLHLMGLLRSGRGYSSADLAGMMGISRRTVFRDVLDVSSLVSIYYDDGYRLHPGTSIANLTLTRDELMALRLGCRAPALLAASPLAGATRSALQKVDEQLEARFGDAAPGADVIAVHADARPLAPGAASAWRVLEEAVRDQHTVSITYYTFSRDEETRRTVDPYGLTFRRHSWYLVGFCHLRHAERVFRLDRVISAKPTPGRFQRPAGFSLERFFADAWEVYASGKKEKVKLAFASRLDAVVRPLLERRGRVRPGRGGKSVFEGELVPSGEFCRWLLALGDDVEVLAPASLRSQVGARLEAAAALYRAAPARSRKKKRK